MSHDDSLERTYNDRLRERLEDMNTPTPRTDAFARKMGRILAENRRDISTQAMQMQTLTDEVVGQLEQELSEAQHKAQQEKEHHDFYRQKCSDYMGAEQEWLKILAERDQLRKVADAFNHCNSRLLGHWRCNAGECQVCKTIELYSQLPHIIEQRKSK